METAARREYRRWPWVLGTTLPFTLFVLALPLYALDVWATAGDARGDGDWGQFYGWMAKATVFLLVFLLFVPICWAAVVVRRAESDRSLRRGRIALGAMLGVILGAVVGPQAWMIYGRYRAVQPDARVVAAVTQAAGAAAQRSVVKPEASGPWVVSLRWPTRVDVAGIAAAVPADAGRWVCHRDEIERWWSFEPAGGGRGTIVVTVLQNGVFVAPETELTSGGTTPCPA